MANFVAKWWFDKFWLYLKYFYISILKITEKVSLFDNKSLLLVSRACTACLRLILFGNFINFGFMPAKTHALNRHARHRLPKSIFKWVQALFTLFDIASTTCFTNTFPLFSYHTSKKRLTAITTNRIWNCAVSIL